MAKVLCKSKLIKNARLVISSSFPESRTICNSTNKKYSHSVEGSTFTTKRKDYYVRQVVMDNSHTRNALSVQMMESLIYGITLEQDHPHLRAIILTGKGNVFSAGHDMKELTADKGKEGHELVFQTATKLMKTIIECPVPVIAKVDGIAAAAGCQLVAQCDLAIASTRSKFSTPGANFGIFCSTPGVALGRILHRKTAMQMILTGLPMDAEEALKAGLLNSVVPHEDLDIEIERLTDAINAKSRDVIALGKKFFYEQMDLSLMDAYTRGEKVMVDNINMEDGQEGIRSFIEKRRPKWKTVDTKSH